MSVRGCKRHGATPREGCDACRIRALNVEVEATRAHAARLWTTLDALVRAAGGVDVMALAFHPEGPDAAKADYAVWQGALAKARELGGAR